MSTPWKLLFIIKPRHQLIFCLSGNSSLLFEGKGFYLLRLPTITGKVDNRSLGIVITTHSHHLFFLLMYKSSIYTNMNTIIFVKIRTVIDLWIQNVTLFNYDKGN